MHDETTASPWSHAPADMTVHWFELADQNLEDLRDRFALQPRSPAAVAAGLVSVRESFGSTEAQWETGNDHAARLGISYNSFGADVGAS